MRLGLVRVGEGLREQISGLIAAKVDELLAEVNALWKELQETLQGRGEGVCEGHYVKIPFPDYLSLVSVGVVR